jgi:glycosyltransferase involved in cell wall biosynthesis
MHILFFLPDLNGGGAQRTMVNLVNAMTTQHGYRTSLVVAQAGGQAKNWLLPSARLVDLGVSRTARALLPLRRLLRQEQPDVLMATLMEANIIAALARWPSRKTRLILRETNSLSARDISGWRRRFAAWAYHQADAVVALSSGVRAELIADCRLQANKVVTIGNPVDIDAIVASADAGRKKVAPFPVNNHPVIIAIGRLTRQKGFDLLLAALARMRSRARLIILGEGKDRETLLEQAQALGVSDRLTLPGFVPDPVVWLAHADLFILSSRWEGFGHVIIEAMAAGTPVIATNCPYGPADILVDGVNGVLVETDNIQAMANAMDRLLGDRKQREKFRHNGMDSIQKFKVDAVLEEYMTLFLERDGR